jgi:hypothetical protein
VNDLERFRALVLADDALQAKLGAIEDLAGFIERAVEAARRAAIPLDADTLRPHIGSNSLAARRKACPDTILSSPPPPGWLPAQICPSEANVWIDWAYFGAEQLSEPFFEQSLQAALRRPLNALVRVSTTLEALAARPDDSAHPAPSGFIFHMSRCGSTLAAQMLAAIDSHVVLSEAAPIDQALQIGAALSPPRVDDLRGMIEAFGRGRPRAGGRYFVKLDCWHTLALPLFRQAFPTTPWVFLYRRPEEVMVSQLWRRGVQMVPDIVSPSLYGLELADGTPTEDYWARVLAAICQAAIEAEPAQTGLLVNYDELPQALWTRILPHFGVAPSADDTQLMNAVAHYDAKARETPFAGDVDAKRSAVTEPIRLACERRLQPVYERLEALRGRQAVDL